MRDQRTHTSLHRVGAKLRAKPFDFIGFYLTPLDRTHAIRRLHRRLSGCCALVAWGFEFPPSSTQGEAGIVNQSLVGGRLRLLLSVLLSTPNKKRLKSLLCDFTRFFAASALITLPRSASFKHEVKSEN